MIVEQNQWNSVDSPEFWFIQTVFIYTGRIIWPSFIGPLAETSEDQLGGQWDLIVRKYLYGPDNPDV